MRRVQIVFIYTSDSVHNSRGSFNLPSLLHDPLSVPLSLGTTGTHQPSKPLETLTWVLASTGRYGSVSFSPGLSSTCVSSREYSLRERCDNHSHMVFRIKYMALYFSRAVLHECVNIV